MTETFVIGAIAAAGLGVAALGVLVWTRMSAYKSPLRTGSRERIDLNQEHSAARYQPMFRLFGREDAEFLREHINCPDLAARWERSQKRIARLYLRDLAADFRHLHREARQRVAQSPEQYHYLVPVLFRQQVAFWRGMLWIELRLSFSGAASTIDPTALVGAIEAIRREISSTGALA
jgi:hypothetical protein